jgi:hypothetical protein
MARIKRVTMRNGRPRFYVAIAAMSPSEIPHTCSRPRTAQVATHRPYNAAACAWARSRRWRAMWCHGRIVVSFEVNDGRRVRGFVGMNLHATDTLAVVVDDDWPACASSGHSGRPPMGNSCADDGWDSRVLIFEHVDALTPQPRDGIMMNSPVKARIQGNVSMRNCGDGGRGGQ